MTIIGASFLTTQPGEDETFMDTTVEPESNAAQPDTAPPAEQPAGRPAHTIVSILVMLVLSAGTLYAVGWLLREEWTAVRSWDLSEPLDEAVWSFPESGAEVSGAGATFEMTASGFGPTLNLDLPAAEANRVQVHVRVTRADNGKPVRFALGWYWARADDVEASPDEPFSPERAMAFYAFARHRPHTYRVDVANHEKWNGTIKKGLFTVKLPPNISGPVRVTMSRVDFLE